jgi:dienelactone hydrolase
VLKAQKEVDAARLAAIGYCFGGTTALETAGPAAISRRSSVHSGLATARPQDAKNIKGKVLVCIGADDPIIPPEQRAGFEAEMKAAGCDWRLQLYGGAGHSFTNPAADSRGMKGFFYHEATDRRSWNAMVELFNETLK